MNLLLRQALKIPPLAGDWLAQSSGQGCAFLIYHSVSGDLKFELDLPVTLFRRQLEFLAQTGNIIAYERALETLHSQRQPADNTFVLTFDDGYADFYLNVFPLLREFQAPAILFVNTGFVENKIPYPILRHRARDQARPVSWEMLGEMAQSGLVTLGAHTHTHVDLAGASSDRVVEELVKPQELFRQRLGLEARHFAYPKALWSRAAEELVARHYVSAVISGGRKATPEQFSPYRIPRIPIRRSDGWLFFRAKTRGWLSGEEAMYVKLRKLH